MNNELGIRNYTSAIRQKYFAPFWLSIILTSLFLVLCAAPLAQAASLTVTPLVIDEKAIGRDILKESVTLTNNTGRKLNVYAFVNDISAYGGKREFVDRSKEGRSTSPMNWIRFPMGVIELSPGEVRTIPFSIEVNLWAKPGVYHAIVAFADGSRRQEAQRKRDQSPSVMVNIEILDDAKERVQLKKFIPDKRFSSSLPVSFSYELENIGNRAIVPSGEVRIYDRNGKEVGVADVNSGEAVIDPDTSKHLASIWESSRGFGRYKALLDLEYGGKQQGMIQDTVFFWVIPYWMFVVVFGGIAFLMIIFVFMLRRFFRKVYVPDPQYMMHPSASRHYQQRGGMAPHPEEEKPQAQENPDEKSSDDVDSGEAKE